MLLLNTVQKTYITGDQKVEALKGVSLAFRKSEFVAILGPSGCGKTTLLNIIGGLDHYTSGDLVIQGRSTKQFKERDWDSYRNHSVGFVFQSYNLIPHQTVLANVELALTLSGVSKSKRRKMAQDALVKVGLGDQMNKKPNQLSGGQMQRVAIARALVNDPEIVLADEPTGALDSDTSIQIMELLKEVAKDRLVIMVTHNPELAAEYSTRTIKLLDGKIVSDSMPYSAEEEEQDRTASSGEKKPSMSFLTALSLSFNNLLTKKTRTILIAFAGSIGIIGIALILSLSSGVKNYINGIESDALSSYPLSIASTTTDSAALMESLAGIKESINEEPQEGIVTTNTVMSQMYSAMLSSSMRPNDLVSFMQYIEGDDEFRSLVSDIQYKYTDIMYIYNTGSGSSPTQVYPNTVMSSMSGVSSSSMSSSMSSSYMSSYMEFWKELIGDESTWKTQYDLVAGTWPKNANDVLIVIDSRQRISDMALYAQGIKDQSSLYAQFAAMMTNREITEAENLTFTYDELMDLRFTAVPTSAAYVYSKEDGLYHDVNTEDLYWDEVLTNGIELNVCGIVQLNSDSISSSNSGTILYTSALTETMLNAGDVSGVIAAQENSRDIDVCTGLLFSDASDEAFMSVFDITALNTAQQAVLATKNESAYITAARKYANNLFTNKTYEEAITALGSPESRTPSTINIYPKDFSAKDRIIELIKQYNNQLKAEGREESVIQYTDYVGLLMSSVSTIISAITWVLVAFVAISLIVSSIMIGVITYISVLERTKEIGILRAIGASKRDIMRVFNAETMVIGLLAGSLGILIAWLFTFPVNSIVYGLTEIEQIAYLPAAGAAILVFISIMLTYIAGLIPARFASKRDPVVALRSE